MPDFEKDYPKIYDNLITNLYEYEGDDDDIKCRITRILTYFDNGLTWNEYDHHMVYNTFFGSLPEYNKLNYIIKSPRDQMIKVLKNTFPDTWEIYLKIIDYYSQSTINLN